MRAGRTHSRTTIACFALASLFVALAPAAASAHNGEDHTTAAPATAPGGGDVTPPAVPEAGAQPAAPAQPAATTPAPQAAAPTAAPTTAPTAAPTSAHNGHAASSAPTVSGGGGDAGTVEPTATATGDLPFTGTAETIRLIALAGMFVPIGVLLYCGARRGDRRLRLAMPRFMWAASHPAPPPPVWTYAPVRSDDQLQNPQPPLVT